MGPDFCYQGCQSLHLMASRLPTPPHGRRQIAVDADALKRLLDVSGMRHVNHRDHRGQVPRRDELKTRGAGMRGGCVFELSGVPAVTSDF